MERKKVAVYSANMYRDMVKETLYGLIQASKREGVKLLFFAGFSDNFSTFTKYTQFTNYDIGDFAIFYLPDLNQYDGLITMDTYLPDYYLDYITELKKSSPVPVVTLGNEVDFTYNVVNDQEKSLENLIDHLIEVHGCREIVHVTGRLDLAFAQVRLRCLHIYLQDGLVHRFPAGEFPRIHINHRQRLRGLNDKIPAGFQPDLR